MSTKTLAVWAHEIDALEVEADELWCQAQYWKRRARLAASGLMCVLRDRLPAAQERHAHLLIRAESLFHQARQAHQRAQLIRQAVEIELAKLPVMEVVQ